MSNNIRTEIQRINGYLREVVTFLDESGKPLTQLINPIMVELKPRDILQLFVGSFLIASPLCFTEEVWNLSVELPDRNAYALILLSFITVTAFIFFNFYRFQLRGHIVEFVKRVLATYLIAISSIVLILSLIDKFPIFDNPIMTIKRVIIIGFPTVFGAIISDYIK